MKGTWKNYVESSKNIRAWHGSTWEHLDEDFDGESSKLLNLHAAYHNPSIRSNDKSR